MKNIVYLTLSICVLASCGKPPASSDSQVFAGNLIADNVFTYTPPNSVDLVNARRLTRQNVLDNISALQTSFRGSYVGYDLKKSLIGVSGDEIFSSCKRQIQQGPAYYTNFEYYDVARRCLARFKDSHIASGNIQRPSFVSSVITSVFEAQNRIYIRFIRAKIISKLDEDSHASAADSLAGKLTPGTEIISIDGVDVQTAIKQLEPYISASTDLGRHSDARDYLFTRSFAYPKKSKATLVLKSQSGVTMTAEVPWIILTTRPGTFESNALLELRGLPKLTSISSDNTIAQPSGFFAPDNLFKDISNLNSYKKEADGEDILVTGIVQANGAPACYLKLGTFDIDEQDGLGFKIIQKTGEDTTQTLSLLTTVSSFLAGCEGFRAPLILDLIDNNGGDVTLANKFFNLFETAQSKVTYQAKAWGTGPGNAFLNTSILNKIDQKTNSNLDQMNIQILADAVAEQKPVTDWLVSRITTFQGVYSGKIFVLTSPNCVSACEITTHRFKKAKRATVIGQPTSGTGFGFTSNGTSKTEFRDPLNLISIAVPNFAFNVIVVDNDSAFMNSNTTRFNRLPFHLIPLMENRPAVPDVLLETSYDDVAQDNVDYIKKLFEIMKQP